MQIDSLLKETKQAPEDTTLVNTYIRLSTTYTSYSSDTGIFYANQGLEIAEELNWKKGVAILKNLLGNHYLKQDNQARALQYYTEALAINEDLKNEPEIAANLGNIGNFYYHKAEYDKALDYYTQSLKLQQKLKNKEKIANNLGNIANIYSYYFDTTTVNKTLREAHRKKAQDYYLQAYSIYKELGLNNGMARNLGNAGNLYKNDADVTESLRLYKEALGLYKQASNNMAIAAMEANIASVFRSVLEDSVQLRNVDTLTRANKEELLDSILQYAGHAMELSRETGFLEALQQSLGDLAYCYSQQGKFEKAYIMQLEYTRVADSLFVQNNAAQIGKIESQFKASQQEKELEIERLTASRRRYLNMFMAAGILTLLIVLFFIMRERKKSERLLLNILPANIAQRLKKHEYPIADQFESASVMFIDMAGFTRYTASKSPRELVDTLNHVFTYFDALAEKYGLEKIKTIGDCYMAVCGLPVPNENHSLSTADMALEIKAHASDFKAPDGTPIHFRIGLDCGPVVAGVIGRKKFIYDLWGDTVNTASRMESTGIIGEIHCTGNFKNQVEKQAPSHNSYRFESRDMLEIKGKGKMQTWILSGMVKIS